MLVKGFVDEVVIFCDGAEIARHARSYARGDFVFDPRHYLALLEQKPGRPGSGRALAELDPAARRSQHLRRLLEARMGKRGKREFIQVLRLTEVFAENVVVAAALEAIRLGAIGFDAVKQLAIAKVENRPAPSRSFAPIPICPRRTSQRRRPPIIAALLSREGGMTATPSAETPAPPRVLLAHHLRQLKLPTVLREYEKVAAEAAREGLDHVRYLLRLVELELIDRERRMVERRIRAARFPAVKSFDTFDFAAIPSLNKPLVLELARCEYVVARDNIIALGNSGTGKTHVAWRWASPPASAAFPSPSRQRRASSIS